MKIPITKPYFDEREAEYVRKAIESGWIVQGPYVAEFERLFAEFVKADFARAASSCTTALHLSLEALGIGKGDKVVVPSFTYVASANAVEYTGAEVVFCDVELETFNIDVDRLGEILKKDRRRRIKAVMPVHLFGLCARMPEILDLARRHGVSIVEDAACGFGARIGDRHAGTFGEAGCFSFHPRKSVTTAEGGMIVTSRREIADTVSSLRDHGAEKSDLQRHAEKGGSLLPEFNVRGFNYRMTDLQGALGVAQLGKASRILEKRSGIAGRYDSSLGDIPQVVIPRVPPGYVHGYQSYVCLFTGNGKPSKPSVKKVDEINARRNSFMALLESRGVATRQGTHAVHTLGYYRKKYGLRKSDFPNAYAADRLSIALPLYAGMTDEEFDYVVSMFREALK